MIGLGIEDPLGPRPKGLSALDWRWTLPLALVAIFVLVNPVGFVGGGADDGRYLDAARCWTCLPTNHWEGRWPVVAPLAWSLEIFGHNRFSIGLPSLVASLSCLILLRWIGDRLFGAPVGLAAALILGLMPVFAIQAYSATAEPIEAAFILGGFALLITKRPLFAGLCFGMAFQVRETAVIAFLLAALTQWRNRPALLALGAGFAAPLLVEFFIYFLNTGDPLYRRQLSLRHTLIPSSELKVIEHRSPFFNANLIANWKHEPGFHIHWLVDGFANLLVNLKTGLLFLLAPLLFAFCRPSSDEKKSAANILAGAFFYSAFLIYVLAIDPKPRMMYVPLAGLALVAGFIAVRCWNSVIATAFVCTTVLSALCLEGQPRSLRWQRIAEKWVAQFPGQIEASQQGYFVLSNKLHTLPRLGSGKPYLLLLKDGHCHMTSQYDPVRVSGLPVVKVSYGNRIGTMVGDKSSMCLFRNVKRPA